MAFFKRVNLHGPKGEVLTGWLSERYANEGQLVEVEQDELDRVWTVGNSEQQLVQEASVDQRFVLTPIVRNQSQAPAAIQARALSEAPSDVKPKKARKLKSVGG